MLIKSLITQKKKTKDANGALKALGGVLAGLGAGAFVASTVNTIRTFEDLEATLRAVTGSAEAASKSFELIRKFTASTTFQVDEVAQAFITLKQAGVVPTSEVLTDFGNLAAGMGKSITQLAQAAFNATTGEMEMLKQFGVIARQQGDTITVTFDGVTKTIERSGASVIDYLRSIGREKFPTAIEERANTLSGAISNLQDAFAEFQVQIGDGGLRSTLAGIAIDFKELLQENEELANMIGSVLSAAFKTLSTILVFLLSNLKAIATFLTVQFVKSMFIAKGATGALTISMKGLTLALGSAKTAMISLGNAAKRNIVGLILTVGVLGADAFGLFGDGADDAGDDVDDLNKELEKLMNGVQDVTVLLNSSQRTTFAFFQDLKAEAEKSGGAIRDLANNDFAQLEQTLKRMQKLEVAKSLFALPRDTKQAIPELMDKSFADIVTMITSDDFQGAFAGMSKGFKDAFAMMVGSVNAELLMGFDNIPELIDFLRTKPFESLLSEQEASYLGFSRSLIDETALLRDAFNNMTDEGLMNMFNTIEQFLPESLQDFETWRQAISDELNKVKEDTNEFSESVSDAIASAAYAFTDDFINALKEGQNGFEAFKDFTDNIAAQIVNIFIQLAVVNKILMGIFGPAGLAISGFNMPVLAGGGTIQKGQPTVVGERGPEIFVPHTGGKILNNMNSNNAMGGSTVVVNQSVNFATGVQATVRNEVLQLMPQIADVTKAAVAEQAARGGRYRGALSNA